jgi:hypothetical protein
MIGYAFAGFKSVWLNYELQIGMVAISLSVTRFGSSYEVVIKAFRPLIFMTDHDLILFHAVGC